jgi:hypothetical protein
VTAFSVLAWSAPSPPPRLAGRRSWRPCCRSSQAGQASGATNASPQAFTDGLVAALPIGAAVLALGAVAALFVPAITPAEVPTEAVALAA